MIIPRNSKIPTTCSQTAYTVVDNQTELLVQVTEGNDAELEFVKIVGESTLSIPAYPKGSPVEIIYTSYRILRRFSLQASTCWARLKNNIPQSKPPAKPEVLIHILRTRT